MKYGRFAKNILIYFSFRKEKRGREEGPEQDPAPDLDLDPPSVNQGTESHLYRSHQLNQRGVDNNSP